MSERVSDGDLRSVLSAWEPLPDRDFTVRLGRDLRDARAEIEGAHKVLDLFDAPRTANNPYGGLDQPLNVAGRIQRLANPTNTEPLTVTVERLRVVVEAAREFTDSAVEDDEQNEEYWTPGTLAAYKRLFAALALNEKPS